MLLPAAAWCGDWNAAAAAKYLDGRAAEWAAWPRAAKEGGPCVSCHTTLGYLMARPALRHGLGESAPTEFENGLVAGVRVRSAKPPAASTADNTQAVLAALVLAMDDARRGKGLSKEAEAAFRTMWATQRADGAWGWTDANLEPWEVPESVYFGAALAAVATGIAPDGYKDRPEIQENLRRLHTYLAENRDRQPMANLLVLLWAQNEIHGWQPQQQSFLDEVWRKQSPDGGWMLAALGPWRDRPNAPPSPGGSNGYATAWTAAMLRLAGVKADEPHLTRALAWLRAHQTADGSWDAVSMNHQYPAGSMMEKFMRDATTAYAALALADRKEAPHDLLKTKNR
ncbi:MAG TPA: hypothetical protein VKX45_08295 [Bryobacteraceae bacterium]|nr:hypothetical protein [Bryobacteraceae bacterium]